MDSCRICGHYMMRWQVKTTVHPVDEELFGITTKTDILKMKVFNKKSNSDMEKETKLLSIKKTTTFKNITPKVLKFSAYSQLETLTKLSNDTMNKSEFPDTLELADIMATSGSNGHL